MKKIFMIVAILTILLVSCSAPEVEMDGDMEMGDLEETTETVEEPTVEETQEDLEADLEDLDSELDLSDLDDVDAELADFDW